MVEKLEKSYPSEGRVNDVSNSSEAGKEFKEKIQVLKGETRESLKKLEAEIKESTKKVVEKMGGMDLIFSRSLGEFSRKINNPEVGIKFVSNNNQGERTEYHMYMEKNLIGRDSLVIESKVDGHGGTGLWRLSQDYRGFYLESGWEPDCERVHIKTKEQLEDALQIFSDRLNDGLKKTSYGSIEKDISNSKFYAMNGDNQENSDISVA